MAQSSTWSILVWMLTTLCSKTPVDDNKIKNICFLLSPQFALEFSPILSIVYLYLYTAFTKLIRRQCVIGMGVEPRFESIHDCVA